MTNYSKWDAFDVDEELEETEKRHEIEDLQREVQKKTKTQLQEEEDLQNKIQDRAEFDSLKV